MLSLVAQNHPTASVRMDGEYVRKNYIGSPWGSGLRQDECNNATTGTDQGICSGAVVIAANLQRVYIVPRSGELPR